MQATTTGDRIKQLRLEYGMTLEQLGDKVGVGKSTVRKWETGMIANMKRDKIAAVAKALNTTPAYLMGWDETKEERNERDLIELREELRRKPEMRMLFSLAKGATPQDLEMVVKLMERFKSEAEGED